MIDLNRSIYVGAYIPTIDVAVTSVRSIQDMWSCWIEMQLRDASTGPPRDEHDGLSTMCLAEHGEIGQCRRKATSSVNVGSIGRRKREGRYYT